MFELAEGVEDPRMAISEYPRFLEQLKGWVDGPPVIEQLDVVGSYNLFGNPARGIRRSIGRAIWARARTV
jgi:hypothetical protein